jgi:DNA-binding MarR family transcriptional regulator
MEYDHVDWLVSQVRQERPDLDAGLVELIGRITRVNHHIDAEIAKSIERYDLRVGELTLLIALRRAGEPFQLTPTELYRAMMVTSGGATRRIDQLESRGLVQRTPHPHDRRASLIGLTPEGRRLVDEAWAHHLKRNRELFDALKPEERRTLADMLRRVLLSIEGPVRADADDA